MTVWTVSLEYNDRAPSDVTGDTGILGVYLRQEDAEAAGLAERQQRHDDGQLVWQYSTVPGRYCGACGQEANEPGAHEHCDQEGADAFCDMCGAENKETGSCDNDHDEWDIDVHVTEHEVRVPSRVVDVQVAPEGDFAPDALTKALVHAMACLYGEGVEEVCLVYDFGGNPSNEGDEGPITISVQPVRAAVPTDG